MAQLESPLGVENCLAERNSDTNLPKNATRRDKKLMNNPSWHTLKKSRWWRHPLRKAKPNLSEAESRELQELVAEDGAIFSMKKEDYKRTEKM
jgi:hypothetical protein